jgi:hypothetical protein
MLKDQQIILRDEIIAQQSETIVHHSETIAQQNEQLVLKDAHIEVLTYRLDPNPDDPRYGKER